MVILRHWLRCHGRSRVRGVPCFCSRYSMAIAPPQYQRVASVTCAFSFDRHKKARRIVKTRRALICLLRIFNRWREHRCSGPSVPTMVRERPGRLPPEFAPTGPFAAASSSAIRRRDCCAPGVFALHSWCLLPAGRRRLGPSFKLPACRPATACPVRVGRARRLP